MPALTEAAVREALRDCYDPAIPCNIIELGLVQSIAVTPDLDAPGIGIPGVPQRHRVVIDLILTTSSEDDAQQQLLAQISNRLAGLDTVSHTTTRVLDSPAWTPQRISPAGRRTLGLEGNPQLVQIKSSLQD